MKNPFWHFTTWRFGKDSDWGEDSSSGIVTQPDHFPNVARPTPKHKQRNKPDHISDAKCKTCERPLVNGSCKACDWGDRNVADGFDNFPIDPVKDDRAGIRAASVEVESRRINEEQAITAESGDWYLETRSLSDGRVIYRKIFPADNIATEFVDRDRLEQLLGDDDGQMSLL